MSDDDALLRVVLNAPDDDTLSLLYVNWLDQHGEAARAAVIRALTGRAGLPAARSGPRGRRIGRR